MEGAGIGNSIGIHGHWLPALRTVDKNQHVGARTEDLVKALDRQQQQRPGQKVERVPNEGCIERVWIKAKGLVNASIRLRCDGPPGGSSSTEIVSSVRRKSTEQRR